MNFDPANTYVADIALSNNNLTASYTAGTANYRVARCTPGIASTVKTYAEFYVAALSTSGFVDGHLIGVCDATKTIGAGALGDGTNSACWQMQGTATSKFGYNNVYSNAQTSRAQNTLVRVAINPALGLMWVALDDQGWWGDVLANQNPATGTGGKACAGVFAAGTWYFAWGTNRSVNTITANFGQLPPFYAPPAGFAMPDAQLTGLVAPTIVQSGFGRGIVAATLTVTLAAAPTAGNTLFAVTLGYAGEVITPPAGWSSAAYDLVAANGANNSVRCWVKPATGLEGTGFAFTGVTKQNIGVFELTPCKDVRYKNTGVYGTVEITASLTAGAANSLRYLAIEHDGGGQYSPALKGWIDNSKWQWSGKNHMAALMRILATTSGAFPIGSQGDNFPCFVDMVFTGAGAVTPTEVQVALGQNDQTTFSNVPCTLATTPVVGNLMVAMMIGGTSSRTAPAGWTQIFDDTSVSSQQMTVWERVVQAGDGTAYTFTASSNWQNITIIEMAAVSTKTYAHGGSTRDSPSSYWGTQQGQPISVPGVSLDMVFFENDTNPVLTSLSPGLTRLSPGGTTWNGAASDHGGIIAQAVSGYADNDVYVLMGGTTLGPVAARAKFIGQAPVVVGTNTGAKQLIIMG